MQKVQEIPNDPEFDPIFKLDGDISKETLLHNKYAFWCHRRDKKTQNYNDAIKKIASFQTVI